MNTKLVEYRTNFGDVKLKLKELMDEKGISINTMSRFSNIKYETVKKYYYGENYALTREILAKFCFILNCNIDDLLVYEVQKSDKLRLKSRERL